MNTTAVIYPSVTKLRLISGTPVIGPYEQSNRILPGIHPSLRSLEKLTIKLAVSKSEINGALCHDD
jgi:hypothetical protein